MPRTAGRRYGRLAGRQIDIQIGRRVRERRETLGMSRETLAAALGISAEQLRRLEAGITSITASRLYWLGVILAVPANDFFETRTGKDRRPILPGRRPAEHQPAPSPAEVRRLVDAMRRILDSAARAGMIGLVAAVAQMADSDGALPN